METSPLWQAVNNGDFAIANALLGRGAEIRARERGLIEHLNANAPTSAANPHRRVLRLLRVYDNVDEGPLGGPLDEAAPSPGRVGPPPFPAHPPPRSPATPPS